LQSLIDDIIKIEEAKKLKAEPTDKMIDAQLERMAKGSSTSVSGLTDKFKAQGVSESALRKYLASQLAFNRLVGAKGDRPQVDEAAVDKKYAELKAEFDKIANDPRMKPVTVYTVQEIDMPVEQLGDAMAEQLLVARAVEARQFMSRYKGCASARAAASGIFNVKIGTTIEADGSKIPKEMKAALEKAGAGHAIGPIRTKGGIQIIGYCGKRSVSLKMPEMPSRDAIANSVYNEQFDKYEEAQLQDLRQKYVIDYKDATYAQ
jgi:peptidyl-prolyl cis-trans isomerase SurA